MLSTIFLYFASYPLAFFNYFKILVSIIFYLLCYFGLLHSLDEECRYDLGIPYFDILLAATSNITGSKYFFEKNEYVHCIVLDIAEGV